MVIDNNPTALPQSPHADIQGPRMLTESKAVQRGKVLIVDDEIDIVRTLQSYLSGKDYKTIGCTSAESALDLMKKFNFDILFLDLVMPELNGIELLKSALAIDPHLIGIIMTGKGTIQSAVDAMKAGAFDYLMKPFEYELLLPVLSRAMDVRYLKKAEERYRTHVEELTYEVRKLQNMSDKPSSEALAIFELKEEVAALKEALRKYKEMEKNLFFNGNGHGYY